MIVFRCDISEEIGWGPSKTMLIFGKIFCKEFGFTAEMLKDVLAKGRGEK